MRSDRVVTRLGRVVWSLTDDFISMSLALMERLFRGARGAYTGFQHGQLRKNCVLSSGRDVTMTCMVSGDLEGRCVAVLAPIKTHPPGQTAEVRGHSVVGVWTVTDDTSR